MFRGINSVTLDAKGRMALPARHREAMRARSDGRMVTTIDIIEHSLLMYALPDWEEIERALTERDNVQQHVRRVQRLLLGHATVMELDGNGRVLLPQSLRDYAQLDRKLVVIGQGNKIEIWSERNWQEWMEAWLGEDKEAALKDIANIDGLSI